MGVMGVRCRTLMMARLGVGLLLASACRGDARPIIEFQAEEPLYVEEDVETGDVELGPGASVGLRVRATADYHVVATAEVVAGELVPDADGGQIQLSGHFEIVPNVELDLASGTASGAVESFEHDFRTDRARFEPFAVGESISLELSMPENKAERRALASIPFVAVELVLDPAPGRFDVTYEGVCLHEEGDAVQYTGRISIDPDIRYAATIEIAVPFAGTQTFGPVEIPVDLPPLEAQAIDLGTYSLTSRRAVEGVEPCAGMDAEPDPEETGPDETGGGSSSTG